MKFSANVDNGTTYDKLLVVIWITIWIKEFLEEF